MDRALERALQRDTSDVEIEIFLLIHHSHRCPRNVIARVDLQVDEKLDISRVRFINLFKGKIDAARLNFPQIRHSTGSRWNFFEGSFLT